MAIGLQLSIAHPIPSLKTSRKPHNFSYNNHRGFGVRCSAVPLPPVNPEDPFIAKLSAAYDYLPGLVNGGSRNSSTLPLMDVFDPKLMATPAQAETSSSYRAPRSRRPPPDLPSIMFDERIVYIGLPLVSAVTELIIGELLYLQWADPGKPIYVYITSTGTTNDDNVPVALETEGFGIYDSLMHMKLMNTEIYTLCLGYAFGQAALLLAAGTKGKRFMMPRATVMIQQPRISSFGVRPASDVEIRAREAIRDRDTFVQLLSKHTGNSVETILEKIRSGPFYMDTYKAIQFGMVDKVLEGDNILTTGPSSMGSARNGGNRVGRF